MTDNGEEQGRGGGDGVHNESEPPYLRFRQGDSHRMLADGPYALHLF